MNADDLVSIRSLTRLALPTDSTYLFRLGVALYGFASVNSFMCEIITYLDIEADRTSLAEKMSGQVLDKFRSAAKNWDGPSISSEATKAATEFERLNTERSDFVHAYPITGSRGEQILHRRKDDKGKYFEVTAAFLDDFIGRLTLVSDALYAIRAKIGRSP